MNAKRITQPSHRQKFTRISLYLAASAALTTAVIGCNVGPDYVPPKVETPGMFTAAPTTRLATTQRASALGASTQRADTQAAPAEADLTKWWEAFNDPMLTRLIERASVNNLDVRLAESRLRQARAQLGIAAAAWYPSLDASGSAVHQRNAVNTQGISNQQTESSVYRTGFDASWEIDVFGGTRRAVESARASLGAVEEDRRAALTSLVSDVATNYVTLRGLQQQIRIARDNIASQRRTLEVNEARANAGVLSDYSVSTARAQVASLEAAIPPLQTQEAAAIYRISILLGLAPGALKEQLSAPQTIPMSLPIVPVGLPSELLRRRPDIRAAERRIAAATADIGVSTADLFPKFSLTGSFGAQSVNRIDDHLDSSHLFYSIGPAVSWNVFDAGRIRNDIRVKNELQNQALLDYQNLILTSMSDVENAITSYSRNVERRESLRQSVEAQRRAVENLTNLFGGGLGDPLDILIAQRDQFNYENQLVQTETDLSANLVSLYKALGGGWENFTENPAPAPDSNTTK